MYADLEVSEGEQEDRQYEGNDTSKGPLQLADAVDT